MQSKREILQKALENINHPLSEITRRTTYRGHSPGVKPMTGIKLNLPKTSTMAAKMERVLADKSPEGKKRMKQMNNLVIGREEDGDKISLEFKTASSRERFRKMMNELSENVHLDEETQHIVNVNVSRTGFRKLEAMIASLDGYRESDYSDGKARFYFDAKKHDSAERKKVAEFIKKTRGAEFSHAIKEDVQLDEGSEILFSFDNPMKAGAFATRIKRDKLASEVDRYVSGRKEMVQIIMHPNDYERNDIEKLAKQYKGQLREERAMTYVIDRKTKKIVHGPTDTGDAKLYVKKQIQPRKFMIRQIRGAAKKVGDTV